MSFCRIRFRSILRSHPQLGVNRFAARWVICAGQGVCGALFLSIGGWVVLGLL